MLINLHPDINKLFPIFNVPLYFNPSIVLQFGQLYQEIDKVIGGSDSLRIQIESKKALAIAYANLLLEDPRMVTVGHLRILGKEFSPEQVCILTRYILSKSRRRSTIFKRTFEEVFGTCKSSSSSSKK